MTMWEVIYESFPLPLIYLIELNAKIDFLLIDSNQSLKEWNRASRRFPFALQGVELKNKYKNYNLIKNKI